MSYRLPSQQDTKDAKMRGWEFDGEQGIYILSKYLPIPYSPITKGKVTLPRRSLANTTQPGIKADITRNGTNHAKEASSKGDIIQPKLRAFRQNNCL